VRHHPVKLKAASYDVGTGLVVICAPSGWTKTSPRRAPVAGLRMDAASAAGPPYCPSLIFRGRAGCGCARALRHLRSDLSCCSFTHTRPLPRRVAGQHALLPGARDRQWSRGGAGVPLGSGDRSSWTRRPGPIAPHWRSIPRRYCAEGEYHSARTSPRTARHRRRVGDGCHPRDPSIPARRSSASIRPRSASRSA
jgi:hypothetical protein